MKKRLAPLVVLLLLALWLVAAVPMPAVRATTSDSALTGRVIVLNPGHGGRERGAVGPTGLEEGIINLKVAQYLKALLEEQGATVFLTREGDYDLDPTAHFSGTRDRLLKDEFAASKNPDLFLIMHHNANDRDRAKDQIEVYYQGGSFGPSKQAAEYILAGLKKWMGLPGLAGPGVFTILNHARGTVVLIEGTYISNPKMEAWLKEDANLRKEAQGYLEGILAFFGAGVPVLEPVEPIAGQKLVAGRPALTVRVKDFEAAGIVPSTVEVRLDQKVIPSRLDLATGLITATPPQPLANGLHRLAVRAANARGNYAVPVELDFYIDRPPVTLALDPYPTIVPGAAGTSAATGATGGATGPAETAGPTVRIAGRVLDASGNPVLDGTLVYVNIDGGLPDKSIAMTKDGFFATEFRPAPGAEIGVVSISAPPAWKELVVQYSGKNSMLRGRLVADPPGLPGEDARLRGADVTLTASGGGPSFQTKADWDGQYVLFDIPPGEYTLTVRVPGYLARESRLAFASTGLVQIQDVRLTAMFGGAFFDRKIAINAALGSPFIAAVVDGLAARLRAAGAEVTTLSAESAPKTVTTATTAPTPGAAPTSGTPAMAGLATPTEVNAVRANLILNVVPGEKWAIYHYPRDKKMVPAAADLRRRLVEKGLVAAESDIITEDTREKVVVLANAPSVILAIPDGSNLEATIAALVAWLADFFQPR